MKKNLKRALAVLAALGTIGLAAAGGKALHTAGQSSGQKKGYLQGFDAATKEHGTNYHKAWEQGAKQGFEAGRKFGVNK